MGVERLQLCFRFCNLCGFFPSRMIRDPISGRFKRFEGHWRHPANWWFVFLLLGQIVFNFSFLYLLWSALISSEKGNLAIVQAVIFILYQGRHSNFAFESENLFLINFRQFEKAIEILNRLDRSFLFSKISCTTRRRSIICISISFMLVRIIKIEM